MCERSDKVAHELRNGGGGDLHVQSEGIALLLEKVDELRLNTPTREEVRKIIDHALSIHTTTCSNARERETSEFSWSKIGLSAKGAGIKVILCLSALLALIVYLVYKAGIVDVISAARGL